MKVKKFRIRPRAYFVARHLRGLMVVKQLPAEIEEKIPDACQEFIPHISSAAFYHTWNRGEIPAPFWTALQDGGLEKAIAVSALIATIGSEPEEHLSQVLLSGETNKAQLVTALCEESAELSQAFIYRLLSDDAKTDDCEVSAPIPVKEGPLLEEALKSLNADQEGVHLDGMSHLSPRFTRVAFVAWMPVNKKKKTAALPKRKSA